MNQDLFFKMIDAAIKKQHLDLNDIDEDFIRIAKEQTFQPMLYYVSKNPKFRSFYIQAFLIHEKFMKVGNLIDKLLNNANIPHVFLKGYDLQNLYPDPVLRMMGDIDVLVDPERFKEACDILLLNNFKTNTISQHDESFIYEGIDVELHFALSDKSKDNISFFCRKINEIDNEYYFLYILNHYAKHYKKGAGIRGIIDIYLLIKNKKYNMDSLFNEICNLKLKNFFFLILEEIDYIFGEKLYEYTPSNYLNESLSHCLKNGIHGFGSKTDAYENYFNSGLLTQRYTIILESLFIPLKSLFFLYPWTKSIILIPLGYICRFFHLIFKRRKKLKQILSVKKNTNIEKMYKSIFEE